MSQVFSPAANTLARLSIVAGVLLVCVGSTALVGLYRSPYVNHVKRAKAQPIPFSHERHVAGNGIDCRYCHTSVDDSSFAGIPPTETCMTCHSQVLSDSPMLAPVRESWDTGSPIEWTRVHDLPDFVYFDHSIHIHKGIGCVTCHGRVDQMPLTWKENTLYMGWCLQCHRNPEAYVRPLDQVYSMDWTPPADFDGAALAQSYGIKKEQLTNCSVCHR